MVKCINEILDIKEILSGIKTINEKFSNKSKSNDELLREMIKISEPIINSAVINKTMLNIYCKKFVEFSDHVKSSKTMTEKDIEGWNLINKMALADIFTTLSNRRRDDGNYFVETYDELYEQMTEYFDEDVEPVVCAHYHALQYFSYKRPMYCYEEVIKLFRKSPVFFRSLYKESVYEFSTENAVDKTYEVCPICDSKDAYPYYCAEQSALYEKDDSCRFYSPAKLWMKCRNCGNMFSYNFPAHSFEEIYNSEAEEPDSSMTVVHKPLSYYYEYPRFFFSKMGNILNRIKDYNNGERYLEIGLGTGEMVAVALEMGYDVTAVEISRNVAESLSSKFDIDVYLCDFMKFDIDKKFDVMIMGDVIEHVGRPKDALKKAYDLLDENGILWLSTPNYESSFSKFRKFSDPMWREKQHFTYFSYKGIRPICEEIGFELKRYEVSDRYNGSMELFLQKKR